MIYHLYQYNRGSKMYREGDIIQIMDKRFVVLGISKETDYSSLSHIIYVFYRDEKKFI